MEELSNRTTPCEVHKPNGDTYDTELYGIYQFADGDTSKPVAVVRLDSGLLGMVNLNRVKLSPVPFIRRKDGTRLYQEED
jgi:hypothetical protein